MYAQVGNYKINAYYAESLDLIKKLLLSGMIMFVYPGESLTDKISWVDFD